MATTPAGIRYPAGTDPINITQDFLNLATDVDTYVQDELTTQNATVTAQLAAQDADVQDTLAYLNGIDIAWVMGAY